MLLQLQKYKKYAIYAFFIVILIVIFIIIIMFLFKSSSLFEGLEEEEEIPVFVPRKNIKKLIVKPTASRRVCFYS